MDHTQARQQIVDEITYLKDELESRRSGHSAALRPMPACVVGAYEQLLSAQYERLERIDDRRNDPR